MSAEQWTTDGLRITDSEVLSRLRTIIDDESPLIIEHRFYRGSRAPKRFVCDDFKDLENYLGKCAQPGDSFYVWRFAECCKDTLIVERGKVPDSSGRVPIGGAY